MAINYRRDEGGTRSLETRAEGAVKELNGITQRLNREYFDDSLHWEAAAAISRINLLVTETEVRIGRDMKNAGAYLVKSRLLGSVANHYVSKFYNYSPDEDHEEEHEMVDADSIKNAQNAMSRSLNNLNALLEINPASTEGLVSKARTIVNIAHLEIQGPLFTIPDAESIIVNEDAPVDIAGAKIRLAGADIALKAAIGLTLSTAEKLEVVDIMRTMNYDIRHDMLYDDPNSIPNHYFRDMEAKHTLAMRLCDEVIAEEPRNPEGYHAKAIALIARGDFLKEHYKDPEALPAYEEAIPALDRAIRLREYEKGGILERFNIYDRGEFTIITDTIIHARGLTLSKIGHLLMSIDLDDEARARFDDAISSYAQYKRMLDGSMKHYGIEDEERDSEMAFEVRERLGTIYARLGRHNDALREYAEAMEMLLLSGEEYHRAEIFRLMGRQIESLDSTGNIALADHKRNEQRRMKIENPYLEGYAKSWDEY